MLFDEAGGFFEDAGLLVKLADSGDAVPGAAMVIVCQREQFFLPGWWQSLEGESPEDRWPAAETFMATQKSSQMVSPRRGFHSALRMA